MTGETRRWQQEASGRAAAMHRSARARHRVEKLRRASLEQAPVVSRKGSMERLQGIAVSPGVAIGEVLVMDTEGFRIPRRFLPRDAVEVELDRLDEAIRSATQEIERNRDRVSEQL